MFLPLYDMVMLILEMDDLEGKKMNIPYSAKVSVFS